MQATLKQALRRKPAESARVSDWRWRFNTLVVRQAPLIVVAVFLWIIAALQWLWELQVLPPDPVLATALAAAVTILMLLRGWSAWHALGTGTANEFGNAVLPDALARLRKLGFRVVDGIPADGGTIDHVIVGTQGIYVITTVRRNAPRKGPRRASFDGKAIALGNEPADETPVVRARAEAQQLRRLINELTNLDLPVQPVMLLPGWQVESTESGSFATLWALAPRDLPMWLANQQQTVHGRNVRLIADALTDYLRRFVN